LTGFDGPEARVTVPDAHVTIPPRVRDNRVASRLAPMRVLVVTNLWPSPDSPARGGFVRDQVQALREIDGLELELFTFETGTREYVRAARELRRRYRGRTFDVIHAHYGLCGWPALALRGAPHVVTFHGTDLAHKWVGPLSRAIARKIALPAPVSATLARAGLPAAGRQAVLPCGVNLDRFHRIDRREARSRLRLDPDAPLLLFPADPTRLEKRYDRAAKLANVAGVELIAYGTRPPEEVPLMINAANAVLAPSEREGFGLAPLEALACDVPVLATDVGVAPLVLHGVEGTLCAPFDAERWSAALTPHLAAEDPRVDGRGRAALFDRNRLAERVFWAYQDVVRTP
jgi:teichuronic acid biosynthesis glycosyltransferase TuaC